MAVTFLPKTIETSMQQALQSLGSDQNDAKNLAHAIHWLSDFYIQNPRSETPWGDLRTKLASLSYFVPLNAARLLCALEEPKRLGFFQGITHVIDFGSGPGTATLALQAAGLSFSSLLVEKSTEALKISDKILPTELPRAKSIESKQIYRPDQTLFIASYSLTETALPPLAYECEAMILLEPSTAEDARRLMALRTKLVEAGFSLWSPCLHHLDCPLLKHSQHDWCHMRAHFQRPAWLEKIEEHLPFRNHTLTWTALFARRLPPPTWPNNTARVIGDFMAEKGKDRQMICRTDEREFIAWLHRNGTATEFHRGDLISIDPSCEKKSNEIRMTAPAKLSSPS